DPVLPAGRRRGGPGGRRAAPEGPRRGGRAARGEGAGGPPPRPAGL
ncbi:MAG: hypothetical protein AVDCRST_MAG06-2089, partial [uncultured Nocardioides sp.]